jgi:hypothetical protein
VKSVCGWHIDEVTKLYSSRILVGEFLPYHFPDSYGMIATLARLPRASSR